MTISYIDAIKEGFPTVDVIAVGNPHEYSSLEWIGGDAIPSQDDLDEWILNNPGYDPRQAITKYEFRQLFTLAEKVAVDQAHKNTNIPQQYRDILFSLLKDLELSEIVHLDNPLTITGVNFVEQIGLIGPGRATQVLSNVPPTI